MTLPTTKNVPGRNPLKKSMLVYGGYKIGKSTLAAKMFPNAIFIAADPTGLEELPVFRVPGDRSVKDWAEFVKIGDEIQELSAKPGFPYEAIVVDGVGSLVSLCQEHVLKDLPGGPTKGFLHASDWSHGKGWQAISNEFILRTARLCGLGLPVMFIAHSKSFEKKNRVGLEITVTVPDIAGASGTKLMGFVDHIFFAETITTPKGESRVLRTQASETYEAGARIPEEGAGLLDPIPLDGRRLRAALEATAVTDVGSVEPQSSPKAPVRKKEVTAA